MAEIAEMVEELQSAKKRRKKQSIIIIIIINKELKLNTGKALSLSTNNK